MRRSRGLFGGASIGTAVVLMAVGAVLAFAVDVPAVVERYVDVLDLGLILVWAGALILVMQWVMNRRPRPRGAGPVRRGSRRAAGPAYDLPEDPDAGDWTARDVHRPGYAGETRRFPTVRDR